MFSYLSKLDYIGVSFYVPLAGNLPSGNVPKEKWQQQPTDQSVNDLADLMEQQWQQWLAPLGPIGPSVEIGEAGIGTTDASMPYDTSNPDSMTTPEGRNVMRHYVRAIGRFAQRQAARFRNKSGKPCMAFMPITFWTVNQCDWLGFRSDWQRFALEGLIEWVRGYNRSTFSPETGGGAEPPKKDEGKSGGKQCVATVALGASRASGLHHLRSFRDTFLLDNRLGRMFHRLYWAISPWAATRLMRSALARAAARLVLQPVVLASKLALSLAKLF
jgi:hypothetical protein